MINEWITDRIRNLNRNRVREAENRENKKKETHVPQRSMVVNLKTLEALIAASPVMASSSSTGSPLELIWTDE